MSDSSDSAVACLLGVFGVDSDGPTGCLTSAEPGDGGNGVRRSSRLARRSAAIEDWPVHRILDSLYSRGCVSSQGMQPRRPFHVVRGVRRACFACFFCTPERPGRKTKGETGLLFTTGTRKEGSRPGGEPGPSSVHLPVRSSADGPSGHKNVSGGHECSSFLAGGGDGGRSADPQYCFGVARSCFRGLRLRIDFSGGRMTWSVSSDTTGWKSGMVYPNERVCVSCSLNRWYGINCHGFKK